MPESDDITLLKEYAESGSEAAFTTLVERHVNLVYSAALRSVGNAHAAQEIAQAVFIILARKAKLLGGKTVLSGWLYQTARLTAANYLRGEIRRQHREQEAYMQSILDQPDGEAWRQIAPLLDDAMDRLGEKDRNAVVLRFFENKNLSEVGAALGASEDAAKMRVNRALEKLRKFFSKRGVLHSSVIIAGAVSANSVQAAPAALVKTISAMAVAKGVAASTSTITLVKGALKIMAWTKAKTAAAAGAVLILAAGTTIVVLKNPGHQPVAKPQPAQVAENSTPPPAPPPALADSQQVNDAKQWALAFLIYSGDNGGRFPKTFTEAKVYAGNLSTNNWEIVSGGNVNNFKNPSENPRIILFRQKEASRTADGKYLKVYAFIDGHVEQVFSDDNDFAALEKQRGFLVRPSAR